MQPRVKLVYRALLVLTEHQATTLAPQVLRMSAITGSPPAHAAGLDSSSRELNTPSISGSPLATFVPLISYTAVNSSGPSLRFHGTRSGCRTWPSQPVRCESSGIIESHFAQCQVESDNGVAMAQSRSLNGESGQHCAWHWQGCSFEPPGPGAAWPPAALVRQALAASGFQAQATALAVPETELQRFSLTLDAGLSARQMHQAIAAQLTGLLTLPLTDAVWDFEISVHKATASPLPGNQPAWLQAAMQTHSICGTWRILH